MKITTNFEISEHHCYLVTTFNTNLTSQCDFSQEGVRINASTSLMTTMPNCLNVKARVSRDFVSDWSTVEGKID